MRESVRQPNAATYPPAQHDFRLLLLGAGVWLGCWLGWTFPWPSVVVPLGVALALPMAVALARKAEPVGRSKASRAAQVRSLRRGATATQWLWLVGLAAIGVGWLLTSWRVDTANGGQLGAVAQGRASGDFTFRVASDPELVPGKFGDRARFMATLTRWEAHGHLTRGGGSITVWMPSDWLPHDAADFPAAHFLAIEFGAELSAPGRLSPADTPVEVAVLSLSAPPQLAAPPPPWLSWAAPIRDGLVRSTEHLPVTVQALVPSLVVGDDSRLTDQLRADFRTAGLTHLLVVSGTNLTLLLRALWGFAAWAGVRGRGLVVVAALGVVGFVILARPEPSVLRAAAMGTVGLVALHQNGAPRSARALGVAVVGLLVVAPSLALSWGFTLSVTATLGLVLWAGRWRTAIASWLPGWLPTWLAEAVAVPLAAQVATLPLIVALSGQVSLSSLLANALVGPAVAPATVIGMCAALASVIWLGLAQVLAMVAGWCVLWIAWVATWAAATPSAALDVPDRGWVIGIVAISCWLLVWVISARFHQPRWGAALLVVLLLTPLLRWPTQWRPWGPDWPPPGWLLVACDVGQGDAIVLNAGANTGVVVDVGPADAELPQCLRRLAIEQVSLVVLTHYHADHVDGLAALLTRWHVGQIFASPLAEPQPQAAQVAELARSEGVAVSQLTLGLGFKVGPISLQVLGPGPWSASDPNNASVVLLVEVKSLRILLTGDIEPSAQAELRRLLGPTTVDVLKVPHHGSRYQDLSLLTGLQPTAALISVGADNDYGHPAPDLVNALAAGGAQVWRTDKHGDLAVTTNGSSWGVVARG